ncbi:MAG: hypothetical protein Q4F27_00635 [Desulfovibrionaceae bacterium]|nr:hypothetical protein [Desulfovibrionaceae bacterium]
MTRTLRFITLLALAGLFALPVAVDAKPDAAADSFKRMDSNKDDKIVMEEFAATFPDMREAAFVAIDRNGDKIIDTEEWAIFVKNHASDMKANKMACPPAKN